MSERRVRIVTRDLFFRAKLEAIARAAGWTVSPSGPAAIAVVELAGKSSLELVAELAGSGVAVLAFGPHVAGELLRAARLRGAEVVPNSKVEARLKELLSEEQGTGRKL
ncbi:MAG: hypothetical protein KatS3mg081_0975 [Gemmatimonadales bacterium]|nr:MAG: hypothetical protein KatS3mg081_0975 [Gemmatimonadales bacterium]